MIRIQRTACPACLTDAPSAGNAYRKREVVKALWDMQHGKCCYSEMLIPQEGHGKAVEHFHPTSIFTWRRNEWANLLLVCPQCNGRKSDRFPVMLTDNEDEAKVVYTTALSDDTPAIIDPSAPTGDDPEKHLTYILDDTDAQYGQVIPRNGSKRGRVTIDVTGIHDDVFLRERFERLNDVLAVQYRNVLRAKKSGDPERLAAELRSFEAYVQSNAKFAGLAREYARAKKLDKNFGLAIPGLFKKKAKARKRK